jgi:hypothetical protein
VTEVTVVQITAHLSSGTTIKTPTEEITAEVFDQFKEKLSEFVEGTHIQLDLDGGGFTVIRGEHLAALELRVLGTKTR